MNKIFCQNVTAVMVRRILVPQVYTGCDFSFFGLVIQFYSMEHLEI